MKKILLILVAIFLILFGIQNSFGNYNGPGVFKLYNYEYSDVNKKFDLISYGSAVYLGDNKIITNAHVVKGNLDYTGNYEICKTIDFKKSPMCFSSAKLLYYDETKDLALLQIVNKIDGVKKIELSNNKLKLGDNIITYGYPSNGGDTITYTSGKISGFSGNLYKIDASIDAGSSGGGAFDNNGKLLGLTSAVVTGYTTLGYIIPNKLIKDFLSKKGNIISYNKIDKKFISFVDKNENIINSDTIDLDYVELGDISKYGFKIVDSYSEGQNGLNNILLNSKSGKTEIYIGKTFVNKDFQSNIGFVDKKLKAFGINYMNVSEININGKNFWYSLIYNKTTKDIVIILDDNTGFFYQVSGNEVNKEELTNAFKLFFNNLKIKGKSKISKNLKVDGLDFSNIDFDLAKDIDESGIVKIYGNTKISSSEYLYVILKTKKYLTSNNKTSLDTAIDKINNTYKDLNNVKVNFITDNNYNIYTVTNFLDKNMYNVEITRESNGYLYSYNFIFIYSGKGDISKKIKGFLKNIQYSGNFFFSKKEIIKNKLKNIDDYIFENNFKPNPNFKFNLTKKESLAILEDIVGKKYNGNFVFKIEETNNAVQTNKVNNKTRLELVKELILIKNKLRNTKFNKYVSKFDKIIPKLSKTKLNSISTKLNKLDFNSKKISKYKNILIYLKIKIQLVLLKL